MSASALRRNSASVVVAGPGLKARRVLLRVANVPWMQDYHGREARLVGQLVECVELASVGEVAYVDNRDGEAQELVEAVMNARESRRTHGLALHVVQRYEQQLREHALRRLLHGKVEMVYEEVLR